MRFTFMHSFRKTGNGDRGAGEMVITTHSHTQVSLAGLNNGNFPLYSSLKWILGRNSGDSFKQKSMLLRQNKWLGLCDCMCWGFLFSPLMWCEKHKGEIRIYKTLGDKRVALEMRRKEMRRQQFLYPLSTLYSNLSDVWHFQQLNCALSHRGASHCLCSSKYTLFVSSSSRRSVRQT